MFAIQPIETETETSPRAGLAGPRALQRRHGLDDGAVLLRAARRHRRGQGVLPRVPGQGDVPRRRADAARAVGRVGRRAVRERQDRRPEAQAGPSAQGASRGGGAAGPVAPEATPPDRASRRQRRAGTTNGERLPPAASTCESRPAGGQTWCCDASDERPALLVSACLLGTCCNHEGGHSRRTAVEALAATHRLVPICPEACGGLPTPRPAAERRGDRVVNVRRRRRHRLRTNAARHAAVRARARGRRARSAVLKARSPSCGSSTVYDGTFTRTFATGRRRHRGSTASGRNRGRERRRPRPRRLLPRNSEGIAPTKAHESSRRRITKRPRRISHSAFRNRGSNGTGPVEAGAVAASTATRTRSIDLGSASRFRPLCCECAARPTPTARVRTVRWTRWRSASAASCQGRRRSSRGRCAARTRAAANVAASVAFVAAVVANARSELRHGAGNVDDNERGAVSSSATTARAVRASLSVLLPLPCVASANRARPSGTRRRACRR